MPWLATPNDVIEFYDKGGDPNPRRTAKCSGLDLNEQEKAKPKRTKQRGIYV